jgi:hypothetical protein
MAAKREGRINEKKWLLSYLSIQITATKVNTTQRIYGRKEKGSVQ